MRVAKYVEAEYANEDSGSLVHAHDVVQFAVRVALYQAPCVRAREINALVPGPGRECGRQHEI